jgi:chaperonin GroES
MLKPLSDRVVLKATEKENITKSGIYIPETANKEKPYMYEVVAI